MNNILDIRINLKSKKDLNNYNKPFHLFKLSYKVILVLYQRFSLGNLDNLSNLDFRQFPLN